MDFEIVVAYQEPILCVDCKRDCVRSSVSTESHIGRVIRISQSGHRVDNLTAVSFSTDCDYISVAREREVCVRGAVRNREGEDLIVDRRRETSVDAGVLQYLNDYLCWGLVGDARWKNRNFF